MDSPASNPKPPLRQRLAQWLRGATVELPVGRMRRPRSDTEDAGLDPVAVTGVAQMLVLLLGALSCALGPKFLLSVLYLMPIAFAALRGGVTSGLVTAVTGTVVLLVVNLWGSDDSGWHHYWNAGSRLAIFVLVVILLTRSKDLNSQLYDQTEVMSSEVELRKHTERISADERYVLQQVATDRPLGPVLGELAQRIEQWHDGSLCALVLFEGDPSRPALVVAPGFPEELRRAMQQVALPEAAEGPVAGRVAEHLRRLESFNGPVWEKVAHLATRFELYPTCGRGVVAGGGEWFGVMMLFARQREGLGMVRPALFEKARDIAAIAIERARLSRELRRVSEMVIDAQEAERRRIARELHDGVNQILSSAAFRIGMIEPHVSASAGDAREELARAKALLTRGIDEIHRISEDLRPSELDALGLIPAIRSLGREFQKKTHLPLRFQCEPSAKRLSDVVELTVYRIIQEALTNIEKHAGATRADLRLAWGGHQLRLTIEDNGRGVLPPAERAVAGRKPGMGLLNMRERTAFLGGTFSIQSTEGQGTVITVRIPLDGLEQIQQVA